LLAILFMGNAQAYRWNMRNDADSILLIKLELFKFMGAETVPFFYIVLPKSKANNVAQYADFDWTGGNARAGFCLAKVSYLVINDESYKQLLENKVIKEITETINGVKIKKPVIIDNDNTASWYKKKGEEYFKKTGNNIQYFT